MSLNVVSGSVKIKDSDQNEAKVTVSLVDVYNTLNLILNELKKLNLHFSIINDKIIEDKDV